jgi:RNA-binding protein 5/10
MAPQIHPNGFRISDRPVAASFAHPYSFQPIPDYSLKDDSCIPSSMALGGLEDAYVKYWDEGSMIAVIEFEVEQSTKPTRNRLTKRRKRRKRKVSHQSGEFSFSGAYDNDSSNPRRT